MELKMLEAIAGKEKEAARVNITHKGTVTLTTKRLILRQFKMNDIQATYHNLTSDEQVVKYLSWDNHKSSETTAELITKWIGE